MKSTNFLKRLFLGEDQEENSAYSRLTGEEQEMIQGIIRLSERTARDVMVPRVDAVFITIDHDTETLLEELSSSEHSRIPIYKDTLDNVIGILYAKDILKAIVSDTKSDNRLDLGKIIRPPYFIPESKRLDSLLREMKKRRVHIAIAVDEYGGVSGIVCLEDIIEEIVGDIQDEFDNEREDIRKIGENVFLCDARADIALLNETLALDIPNIDFDTLGGWVFELFGRIPTPYETVTNGNIDFTIQQMDGNKIETIKVIVKERDVRTDESGERTE